MNTKLLGEYKVILWDFDGVIIDSDKIRIFGFREVLKEYPQIAVDKLIDYHLRNGGLSRYVKFRYFFEQVLGQEISNERIKILANSFSQIMVKHLKNPQLVIEEALGCIQFLHKAGKTMHIVSGSDELELLDLTHHPGLYRYFESVKGSPTPKVDLVKSIIDNSIEERDFFCLIGDSINDYQAASSNGIKFFGYNNEELINLDGYL